MIRTLTVFLHDQEIGVLKDKNSHLSFTYASGAKNPLSVHLPIREEPYPDRDTRPFFENLLPEGDSRFLIAKKFGVSANNPFSLLQKIGQECAGAVSLYPLDERPPERKNDPIPLSEEEFEDLLESLPTFPLLTKREVKLSLAGAQSKIGLYLDDQRYLPTATRPSNVIIKPASAHYQGFLENEFFCLQLAAHLNIHTIPPAMLLKTKKGIPYLQIERYDRKKEARIHQEDFCQALGYLSTNKYQADGGPSLQQCFRLIEEQATFPARDTLALLRGVLFNFLIGNSDVHAKNFSLLHGTESPSSICLAPFYDLISTQVYPELSKNLAMRIGREYNPDKIRTSHFLTLLKESHIHPKLFEREKHTLVSKLTKLLEKQEPRCKGIEKIKTLIRIRVRQLCSLI